MRLLIYFTYKKFSFKRMTKSHRSEVCKNALTFSMTAFYPQSPWQTDPCASVHFLLKSHEMMPRENLDADTVAIRCTLRWIQSLAPRELWQLQPMQKSSLCKLELPRGKMMVGTLVLGLLQKKILELIIKNVICWLQMACIAI